MKIFVLGGQPKGREEARISEAEEAGEALERRRVRVSDT